MYVCITINNDILLPVEIVPRRPSGISCHLPCGRRVALTQHNIYKHTYIYIKIHGEAVKQCLP